MFSTKINGTETWITERPLSVDIGFFFISLFVDFYICTGICSVFIELYVPCQTLPFSSVVFLPAHVISQINEIMLSSPWL